MGFFDRVKQLFGKSEDEEDEQDDRNERAVAGSAGDRRPLPDRAAAARRGRGRGDDRERPPLAEAPPPSQSIEDALAEREAGRKEEARKILIEIDRGGGLRTVLRAAAAIEAKDEDEARELALRVAREEAPWRLALQVAAALGDPGRAKPLIERAAKEGAPPWALAWARATADDEAERREGLVDLLFADAPLARTVAARDLAVPGVVADGDAGPRYAAFAHGRDSIKRFGADLVAEVLRRAYAPGGR